VVWGGVGVLWCGVWVGVLWCDHHVCLGMWVHSSLYMCEVWYKVLLFEVQ